MALLEARRKKLAEEGLFDAARKRKIPFMPRVVGVVTSPTGAVIRDILHRLSDRFPVRVVVWPVRVQGETSAAEVAAAIDGFNALEPGGPIPRPDVLIVARGGGSLEDLWSFNEEIAVRAVAAQRHPADRRGRPRNRLDADRPRRRPARPDPDRGGRIRRAGARRTHRDAGRSRRPEARRDPAPRRAAARRSSLAGPRAAGRRGAGRTFTPAARPGGRHAGGADARRARFAGAEARRPGARPRPPFAARPFRWASRTGARARRPPRAPRAGS